MRKFLMTTAAGASTAIGARVLFASGSRARRVLARSGDRLARLARFRIGQWNGLSYRMRGRRPDADITDNVLADRIRSSIVRHRHPDSKALHALVSAVTAAGVDAARARSVVVVVVVVLSALAERVPAGEPDHLLAHLPEDVRQQMRAPRRIGPPAAPATLRARSGHAGFGRGQGPGRASRAGGWSSFCCPAHAGPR